MTQRTRNIIAVVFLGVSVLAIIGFVAQHFMTSPRPPWHKDLVWLALAASSASGIARGRPRQRAMENPD